MNDVPTHVEYPDHVPHGVHAVVNIASHIFQQLVAVGKLCVGYTYRCSG
jgi:hypothetical protein